MLKRVITKIELWKLRSNKRVRKSIEKAMREYKEGKSMPWSGLCLKTSTCLKSQRVASKVLKPP
jgi:riboflavin synthase alpha subunit